MWSTSSVLPVQGLYPGVANRALVAPRVTGVALLACTWMILAACAAAEDTRIPTRIGVSEQTTGGGTLNANPSSQILLVDEVLDHSSLP